MKFISEAPHVLAREAHCNQGRGAVSLTKAMFRDNKVAWGAIMLREGVFGDDKEETGVIKSGG